MVAVPLLISLIAWWHDKKDLRAPIIGGAALGLFAGACFIARRDAGFGWITLTCFSAALVALTRLMYLLFWKAPWTRSADVP